jgi:hypothetical protein
MGRGGVFIVLVERHHQRRVPLDSGHTKPNALRILVAEKRCEVGFVGCNGVGL